jgi:hypothetical protein
MVTVELVLPPALRPKIDGCPNLLSAGIEAGAVYYNIDFIELVYGYGVCEVASVGIAGRDGASDCGRNVVHFDGE